MLPLSYRPNSMALFVILLFLTHIPINVLARLRRRENALTTVEVPLGMDIGQRYLVNVNIPYDSTPQNFNFALTTSTGYCMVVGSTCNSCGNTHNFNQSMSSSSTTSLIGTQSIELFNGSASGPLIKEDCALREASGLPWKYPNQTMIVANQSNSIFSSEVSGILGLGTTTNGGSFSDTFFGAWLSRNPTRSNVSFALALNPPNQNSSNGGVLHLLAPETSAYQGLISWNNVVASAATSNASSDWIVQMDGWSFHSANGGNNVSHNGGLQTILDPYYSDLYFPQDQARLIYASIPGAVLQTASSNLSESWTVPCSTQMALSITFGSQPYTLDESALITQQGDTCMGVVKGWSASNITDYLLGATFISSVYTIYNVMLPGSDSPNSVGIALRAAQRKAETGLIVGATLGSLALAIAIAVAVVVAYRSRRTRGDRAGARAGIRERLRPTQLFSLADMATPGDVDCTLPLMRQGTTGASDYNLRVRFAGAIVSVPQTPAPPSARSSQLSPSPEITISIERNSENLLRNSRYADGDLLSPHPHSISGGTNPVDLTSRPDPDFTIAPFDMLQPTALRFENTRNGKGNHPSADTDHSSNMSESDYWSIAGVATATAQESSFVRRESFSVSGDTIPSTTPVSPVLEHQASSVSGSATVVADDPPAYTQNRLRKWG